MEDTDKQIFFYEHDYYIFSNFSSFAIEWKGKLYMTSECAYHSEKFDDIEIKEKIRNLKSSHEAFKFAENNKHLYKSNWNDIKLDIMKDILRSKVEQHPYVLKKLIDSGDKELVENSWRDSYWGWGENRNGENHLGKLWMEIRKEFKNKYV